MRRKLLVFALLAAAALTAFLVVDDRENRPARSHADAPRLAPPADEPAPPETPPPEEPPAAAPQDESPSPTEAAPALAPDGVVTGRVRMHDGSAPDAASLVLRRGRAETVGAIAADGSFRFEGLAPDRYTLLARHPACARHEFQFELPAGGAAGPFDVVLRPGGALRVVVREPWGAPMMNERVRVRGGVAGVTNADGVCVFAHLPAGSYFVRHGNASRAITVVPGDTVEVVFDLACGLRGVALDPDGAPLPRAIVRVMPVEFGHEGYRNVEARTDADGAYEMSGVPEGEYRVVLQVLGKRPYVVPIARVRLFTGQIVDLPLRVAATALAGTITRADTGAPLGRRDVQITAALVDERGRSAMAFADEKGRYAFVGLPPGRYELWIAPHRPELEDARRVVDFRAGGDLGGVDFALATRALGTLRLTVREPDGSPATGLLFAVRRGKYSVTLHAKQVGDGVFEILLPVGVRRVSAIRRGFRAPPVEIEIVEGKTVERAIVLARADG